LELVLRLTLLIAFRSFILNWISDWPSGFLEPDNLRVIFILVAPFFYKGEFLFIPSIRSPGRFAKELD
jgi:hypothetical protein